MAEVSGLHVKISADPTELERGLNKAKGAVAGFESDIASAAKTALGFFATFASTRALVQYTRETMDAIDATSKLARELDTPTESLGTLNRAASYAGLSSSDLENSLRILNRTIGDGIDGNQKIRDTFDRLGLSLTDIAEMDADQRILTIGDAIRGLGSSAERASALSDLFGKSGMKMSELVMGSAESLRQAADEAKNLGIAINDIDARQVEAANDAITRTGGTLQGIGNTFAIRVSPYIEAIANKLSGLGGGVGFVNKAFDALLGVIAYVIASFQTAQDVFTTGLIAIRTEIAYVKLGMYSLGDAIANAFVKSVNLGIKATNGLMGIWNDFVSATKALPGGGLADSMKVGIIEPFKAVADNAAGVREEIATLTDALNASVDGFEGIGIRAERIAAGFMATEEAARNAAIEANNAQKALMGGGEVKLQETDEEKAAREKAAKALADYRKQLTDKLAALVESQLSEEEALIAQKEKEVAILNEGLAAKLVSEQDYRDMLEEIEFKHVEAMIALRRKQSQETQRTWADDAADVAGRIEEMTSSVAGGNRAMFELSKVASISKAILKSREAGSSAYAVGAVIGGPPLGAVMAGIAAAATAAQIAQLASTTYGGAGGTSASSSTASSGATSAQAASQGQESEKGAYIQINLQGGGTYSADQVRGLISAINEQVDSGMVIRGVSAA